MTKSTFDFISADGEIADLVRSKDWENTPVGSPNKWQLSLRTTLSTMLNSNFPMFLFWGKELICFYNDAYRPSLGLTGKHPALLGVTAKEGWGEVYEQILEWTNHVFETGKPLMFHDNLVPFFRNGRMEDIYWTFSYSAVIDDSGKIGGVLVTCMETTKQVESLLKLQKSKADLQFAMDAAELGTFDFNPTTQKFTADSRVRNWYGFKESEDYSLASAFAKINENDRELLADALSKSTDTNLRTPFDIDFRINNDVLNKEITVRARGNAIFEEGNPVALSLYGTVQDITEQRAFTNELERQIKLRTQKLDEANKELETKNRILERTNKELRSFSYITSHDLQEPLRKIQTFASRILEKDYGNLSEKGRNYFDRMRSSANRMQSLIQDLLSYSRIDNNQGEFELISIQKLINAVTSELQEETEEKNSTISITGDTEIKLIYFQFFQLFYNLISNSLKFAKSEVKPDISIQSEIFTSNKTDDFFEKGKSYCKITFKDNGIGFESSQNHRVFELFQRLHGRSEYEGTGIGLAIVKKIVENHFGKIEAVGVPGEGVTFIIHLPV